jgi:hypothetical protein
MGRTAIYALRQLQDRCHLLVTAVEFTVIASRNVDRERSPPSRQKANLTVYGDGTNG